MSDMARGSIIGVLIAVILAGFVVAMLDFTARHKPSDEPRPPGNAIARIGPDGTDASFFGDDVRNAPIPRSRPYDICIGELRVQRPPMMTSDMPDSYCTVTRRAKGLWRMSTGGWQQCQAVCFRIGKK